MMKTSFRALLLRVTAMTAIGAFAVTSLSCMTTYDAYGRPVQSVDPGAAVAGAAAAGVLGYAIANNRNDHHHGYRDRGRHHGYRDRGRYRHY